MSEEGYVYHDCISVTVALPEGEVLSYTVIDTDGGSPSAA